MERLKTATVQAATIAAILGLDAGHSWLIEGHGLHPMAAGALAAVLFIFPHFYPAPAKPRARFGRRV